jgi:hypothetical protein
MTQQNHNNPLKCPYCACIFFNQQDLDKHLISFGKDKTQHEYNYRKVHGRLEHGYGEE